MFGYVEALSRAGVDAVIVCVSRELSKPERWRHPVTGSLIIGLPEPRVHRVLNGRLRDPYAADARSAARGRGCLPGRRTRRMEHALLLRDATRSLIRELRRLDCSAIVCQEYEFPRFDVMVGIGRALRLPVFATYQGGTRTTHPSSAAYDRSR